MRLLAELSLAKVVLLPAEAEVDDRPGRMRPGCFAQAGLEYRPLGGLVADIAEREAEGVLDEAGKRGLAQFGDLADEGDGDRRKPVLVEDPLEQSHGLLADRSGGDEQGEVDGVGHKLTGDRRPTLPQERTRVGDVAHE